MSAASTYVNPFGGNFQLGRTDQGVDVTLKPGEPIRALGDATVIGTIRNWYRGQPLLWYRLNTGPARGRYVYVAEQITDLAAPGTHLRAGDPVARYAQTGTALETGWATATGQTLAQATTGYTEGQQTPAGKSFRDLLTGATHGVELLTTPPAGWPANADGGGLGDPSGPTALAEKGVELAAKKGWGWAQPQLVPFALKVAFVLMGAFLAVQGLAVMLGRPDAPARLARRAAIAGAAA